MRPNVRVLSGLCWRLIQGTFTQDYSGVNRWKNHHLSGGDPSGKCVIAFFNGFFGEPLNLHYLTGPQGVQYTGNATRVFEADAVVFHIPTLRNIPIQKRPGQLWVAWSLESTENYPCLKESDYFTQFDLTMTFHMKSDVWYPYIVGCSPSPLEDLRQAAPPKTSSKLISSFISSGFNLSHRQEYHAELAQHLAIHAYGNLGRTHTLKQDKGIQSKRETIAQYKFTIGFENAIENDYVTEKFFDPLLVGSVPVYLGAPNVRNFAPGNHCYIDATDFPNPKILAEYIQHLDQDDAAYSQYFEWKHQPYPESFLKMAESCLEGQHPFEKLGALVLSKKG